MSTPSMESAPWRTHEQLEADPTLDVLDGSQAVEVAVLHGDRPLQLHHLRHGPSGRKRSITLVVAGIGLLVAAGVLFALGQRAPAALALTLGPGIGVLGVLRARNRRRSSFTLGTARQADLHLDDPAIPTPCFPVVRCVGGRFCLLFAKKMDGAVAAGQGEAATPRALASTDGAREAPGFPGGREISIAPDARCVIRLGQISIFVRSTPPARRLRGSVHFGKDRVARRFCAASVCVHAVALGLVLATPPSARVISTDAFAVNQVLVQTRLSRPVLRFGVARGTPAWLGRPAGGGGRRHVGAEGGGSRHAREGSGRGLAMRGPRDNPSPRLPRQEIRDAFRTTNVLQIIGQAGGPIRSVFGSDTALGADAEDAMNGLLGRGDGQGGEIYGVGGLGLVGTGRGGGGTGEGTIGLGSLGTVGRGGGVGQGAGYGRGVGRMGVRRARAPRVIACATRGCMNVRGAMSKEIIRRIIRRHINEIKYCYQKELSASPSLTGRILLSFVIAGNGRVMSSRVLESSLANRKTEQCVARAIRRWLFPKPRGGGVVVVSYPFVFRVPG